MMELFTSFVIVFAITGALIGISINIFCSAYVRMADNQPDILLNCEEEECEKIEEALEVARELSGFFAIALCIITAYKILLLMPFWAIWILFRR